MGSSFHECIDELNQQVSSISLWSNYSLYLSGRYALLDLILYKKKHEELTEIYIPSYYCHDVTRLIENHIEVKFYECSPISVINLSVFPKNSTVLVVEYIGNKAKTIGDNTLDIILDKTHNPFSNFSYYFSPKYTFGSLRKILPIGDGGFLFPKLENTCQKGTELNNKNSVLDSLKYAMYLKSLYLQGENVSKDTFLKLFNEFESFLNNTTDIYKISETSLNKLNFLDLDMIYKKKYRNLKALYGYYRNNKKLILFKNDCYFSFLISFDSYDFLKKKLVNKNIYPIVLWPNYNGNINLINGSVLVSLHADFRYEKDDIKKLTYILDGIFCELKIYGNN